MTAKRKQNAATGMPEKPKSEESPKSEWQQTVWIEFSDGTKAGFNGRAVCFQGDKRTIRDISFTEPKPLEEGCYWGSIPGSIPGYS